MTPMTQILIERAVASALGEDLATVRRLGFGPATFDDPCGASDVRLVLDCPFCGRRVDYPGRGRDGSPALGECAACDIFFEVDDDEVYVAAPGPDVAAIRAA
jgi:hypothetical protein